MIRLVLVAAHDAGMTHNIGRPRTGSRADQLDRATQQLAVALREVVEAVLDEREARTPAPPGPVAPNDPGIEPRRWYTTRQAAELVGRHPHTVMKALEVGELPGRQRTARGRWAIRGEDLEAWISGEASRARRRRQTPR